MDCKQQDVVQSHTLHALHTTSAHTQDMSTAPNTCAHLPTYTFEWFGGSMPRGGRCCSRRVTLRVWCRCIHGSPVSNHEDHNLESCCGNGKLCVLMARGQLHQGRQGCSQASHRQVDGSAAVCKCKVSRLQDNQRARHHHKIHCACLWLSGCKILDIFTSYCCKVYWYNNNVNTRDTNSIRVIMVRIMNRRVVIIRVIL